MANILQMAAFADIVTLIQAGSSDRRIPALLSLDRGTVAQALGQAGQIPRRINLRIPSKHSAFRKNGEVNAEVNSCCKDRMMETTQGT